MFLQNGLDDYLSKPIDTVKMHDMLMKWIPEDKWKEAGSVKVGKKTETPDRLEIKGVNISKGIAMNGGSVEKYLKTLAIFYKDGLEKSNDIQLCLDAANLPLYTIFVHALKSAAANIGAESLSDAAGKMEDAGKDGNLALVRDRSVKLLLDLNNLLININSYLASAKSSQQSIPADKGFIKDELLRLKDAVDSFDATIILESSDNLRKYTHADDIGSAINEILQYVLIGDDDEAVSLISSVLQSL